MRKKDPFKNVIGEYVMIFIVFGFILWVGLGSITELLLPLDYPVKIIKAVMPLPVLIMKALISKN